jgi:hypothetical protein
MQFHLHPLHLEVSLLNQPLQHGIFLALIAWCSQPLQHGLMAMLPLSPDNSKPVTKSFYLHAFFHITQAIMSFTISHSPQIFDTPATNTTMNPVPHIHYYCALHGLHGNMHSLYHSVLLCQHVDDWVTSYSAPSSILDGALAMLSLPSTYWWTTLCTLTFSFSSHHSLTHQT